MHVEDKLRALGIVLPELATPLAAYVSGRIAGEFIYVSRQLPIKNGIVIYTGKLGGELAIETGLKATRLALINCLAVLKKFLPDWSDLLGIIKVTGYIQSTENFYDQPNVLNGASELLEQIFGETGKHARAAVGVAALPLNAACEVELIAQIKKDGD